MSGSTAKAQKAERESAAVIDMLTRTSKYDRLEKIGEGTYGIVYVRVKRARHSRHSPLQLLFSPPRIPQGVL